MWPINAMFAVLCSYWATQSIRNCDRVGLGLNLVAVVVNVLAVVVTLHPGITA